MSTKKNLLHSIALSTLLGLGVAGTHAAPLPNGTVLTIEPGNSGGIMPCTTGSCFSFDLPTAFPIVINIGPGTDGGLIVGKNQTPGGQEGAGGGALSTSGQLSAAWYFFANYGSFATSIFSGARVSISFLIKYLRKARSAII